MLVHTDLPPWAGSPCRTLADTARSPSGRQRPNDDREPMPRSSPVSDAHDPFRAWPRPLAFVLSGGGAYGPVQVGMLRALAEIGVRPDLIVGTSVGALNGAFVAAGSNRIGSTAEPGETSISPETVDALTDLWAAMNRRTVFSRRRAVLYNLARRGSLAGFERLGRIIDDHIGLDSFDDLVIPFAAVATDALTGEPELLRAGPLKPALLASAAVPGLFPVAMVDGRPFIDGGVSANLPIRQAIAFGARSIVSMDATQPVVAHRLPRGLVGGVAHSTALMVRNQRSNAIDELAHRYPIVTMPTVTPPGLGTFDFSRTDELLETSYRSSIEVLQSWSSTSRSSSARAVVAEDNVDHL